LQRKSKIAVQKLLQPKALKHPFSTQNLFGRAEIDDRISLPFKDFIMIGTTKTEQDTGMFATIEVNRDMSSDT